MLAGRPARRSSLIALVVFCTFFLQAALAGALTSNTDVRRIADKLQCPVCEGTSVADSPSPVAVGMRDTIRAKLDAGESEAAIIAFFVDRYGPAIFREPPRTGFYSAVWWVPGLGLLLGVVVIYGVVKGRRRQAPATSAAPGPALNDQEIDYRSKLRSKVQEDQ